MALKISKHGSLIRKTPSIAWRFMVALRFYFVRFICVVAINVGLSPAGPAFAADEVARAEAWFNKISSIEADFVQVASDGTAAEGKLLFRRPSQMKITYRNDDGGKGLQLITSKIWLHVNRPDDKLLTSYPLSETPLSLILAAKVSLRPGGYETRVIQSSAGVLQILIAKEKGEGAGQLTLEFSEKPFQFRRWVVVDATGVKTSVTLFNPDFDVPIPNAEFKIPYYSEKN